LRPGEYVVIVLAGAVVLALLVWRSRAMVLRLVGVVLAVMLGSAYLERRITNGARSSRRSSRRAVADRLVLVRRTHVPAGDSVDV